MTGVERSVLSLLLEIDWEKAHQDYRAVGKPFGEGRGLDIWVEHGQLKTVN